MKAFSRPLACAVAFSFSFAAQAQLQGAELMAKKGCRKCHALDTSRDAISLKEIAAKYRGKSQAVDALSAEYRKTRDHARFRVSDEELKALAEHVLSLK